MPREIKVGDDSETQTRSATETQARRDLPSAQSHGGQGDPNDWIVTAMGVGATDQGEPRFRRGDTIPARELSADQIRRLLDAGAIAPRYALPPVVTSNVTAGDVHPL